MALRTIAEVNKSPLTSPIRQAVVIPFRFLTGASAATGVVIPGGVTVTRTSSTVYYLTIPGTRITGSLAAPSAMQWCQADLAAAQYVNDAAFTSSNGATIVTLTFSAAPTDGTQVRGAIWTNAAGVA